MLELITTYIFNVIFIALLFVLTSTQTFVSVTTTNTKSASIHVEGTAKQHRRHLLNLATYLFVFTKKRKYEQCAICVSQTSPVFTVQLKPVFVFVFPVDFSGLTHCLRLGNQEISERTLMHR